MQTVLRDFYQLCFYRAIHAQIYKFNQIER